MKSIFASLNWLLSAQFGLDIRRFIRGVRGILPFVYSASSFRRQYRGVWQWQPCLQDWGEEGGSINNEYFWQDLVVARMIYHANPTHHVDVGSRLDGFVAHVASFRSIEVFDVRPVRQAIPGVLFRQRDLMQEVPDSYCDSLSCLHALEHFGLGRYGDPLDPNGHEKGISNLAGLLHPGGTLYLSVPIGRERVVFNANRIFAPSKLLKLCGQHGLRLQSLTVIGRRGEVTLLSDPLSELDCLDDNEYQLGLFVLQKH